MMAPNVSLMYYTWKTPWPCEFWHPSFLPCNNLPPLTDVDVTGSQTCIEHVARCIQGGAGPGGSSACNAMAGLSFEVLDHTLLRRIVCKALALATGSDVHGRIKSALFRARSKLWGSCSGHQRPFWGHWGLLLVDAKKFLEQSSCIMECEGLMAPFTCNVINKRFWPSVFGGLISTAEQHLSSLPTRFGSMGIFDPVELAKAAYITSRASTSMVVNAIKNNADFVVSSHSAHIRMVKLRNTRNLLWVQKVECDSVLVCFGNDTRRAVQQAIDGKTSACLAYCYMLIACHHFDSLQSNLEMRFTTLSSASS